MYLAGSDNAIFRYRYYLDNYEKTLIDSYLKFLSENPRSIAIDIGASYGAYSLKAANIGQYGLVKKIYSFEPDEIAFNSLKRSIDANNFGSIIEANKTIVGDYDGEADLLLSHRASTSNQTFISSEITTTSKRKVKVPCVSLDSYILGKINPKNETFIIKIDVEGSELRVLKGMKNLLDESRGYALFCEFYPQGIKDCGNSVEEFRLFFSNLKLDKYFLVAHPSLKEISKSELFQQLLDLEEESNTLKSLAALEFVVSSKLPFGPD